MKKNEKMLKKKGWPEYEIKKTIAILDKEKAHDAFFSKIVFYSSLLVIIFANLMISFAILFLAVALSSWLVYLVAIVLALVIGFLYNFLITDIGHIEKRHHVFALITIPLIALMNIIVMVLLANKIILDLGLNTGQHNIWILAITFALVFLLPSLVDKIFREN
jgi:hypothetical protein